MPKPTLAEAEWNVDGTNELVPGADYKSDGWGVDGGGKTGVSKIMNYWKRRVYLWLAWLDGVMGDNGPVEASNTRWQVAMVGTNENTNVISAGVAGSAAGVEASGGAGAVSNPCTIDLRVGDRITAIKATCEGTGAAQNVTAKLCIVKVDGGFITYNTVVATLTIVDPGAGAQTASLTLGTPHTVADGESFYWQLAMPLAGTVIGSLGITKDRLNG
jgi:hypothetical protein